MEEGRPPLGSLIFFLPFPLVFLRQIFYCNIEDAVYPLRFQTMKFRTVAPFLESVNDQILNLTSRHLSVQFHKHRGKK